MTWYIFPNSITKLFVSMSMLTTLSFDSEIVSYLYGGSKEEMFFEVTNSQKTLAMKSLKTGIETNLMIVTKKQRYYFEVINNRKVPHQFIEVKRGKINNSYKYFKKTSEGRLFKGRSSLMLVLKNGNKKYLSAPFEIN